MHSRGSYTMLGSVNPATYTQDLTGKQHSSFAAHAATPMHALDELSKDSVSAGTVVYYTFLILFMAFVMGTAIAFWALFANGTILRGDQPNNTSLEVAFLKTSNGLQVGTSANLPPSDDPAPPLGGGGGSDSSASDAVNSAAPSERRHRKRRVSSGGRRLLEDVPSNATNPVHERCDDAPDDVLMRVYGHTKTCGEHRVVSDLHVWGSTSIKQSISVEGNMTAGGAVTFENDVVIKGDINVEGTSNIHTQPNFENDVTFKGNVVMTAGDSATLEVHRPAMVAPDAGDVALSVSGGSVASVSLTGDAPNLLHAPDAGDSNVLRVGKLSGGAAVVYADQIEEGSVVRVSSATNSEWSGYALVNLMPKVSIPENNVGALLRLAPTPGATASSGDLAGVDIKWDNSIGGVSFGIRINMQDQSDIAMKVVSGTVEMVTASVEGELAVGGNIVIPGPDPSQADHNVVLRNTFEAQAPNNPPSLDMPVKGNNNIGARIVVFEGDNAVGMRINVDDDKANALHLEAGQAETTLLTTGGGQASDVHIDSAGIVRASGIATAVHTTPGPVDNKHGTVYLNSGCDYTDFLPSLGERIVYVCMALGGCAGCGRFADSDTNLVLLAQYDVAEFVTVAAAKAASSMLLISKSGP